MFDFLTRRKKQASTFSPLQELHKLVELSPPSALVSMSKDKGDSESEELGKAFFLRHDKKLYTEGNHLYLIPEYLKIAKDQNLTSQKVFVQFMNRRIPYRLECKIIGRFRLLPEVIETLDFKAKSAYKVVPIGSLKKEDKRHFFRYTSKNYGDSRIPLTTHIGFDLYIRKTDQEFPVGGAPPVMLKDIEVLDFHEPSQQQPFATRDAINQFRALMLKKQPHERFVYASKVDKDDTTSLVKRKDEELLLGEINILGLEMESLRDVLYLKKSAKAAQTKGKDNPYRLQPGEKIITNFVQDQLFYQMLVEVMEARTQNEVVRPIELPTSEEGLKVDIIDYSVGGALIESNVDFLKFILGDKCPSNVDDEVDFSSDYWEEAFTALQFPMLHLTFYPKLNFPDAVKRFKPELPFKICMLAQIVRTRVHQSGDRTVLQHGIQFCYEPQGIPLRKDDPIDWRYSRYIRDNEYFKTAHSQLSQLYSYLENQSLSTGSAGRQRRPPIKEES